MSKDRWVWLRDLDLDVGVFLWCYTLTLGTIVIRALLFVERGVDGRTVTSIQERTSRSRIKIRIKIVDGRTVPSIRADFLYC